MITKRELNPMDTELYFIPLELVLKVIFLLRHTIMTILKFSFFQFFIRKCFHLIPGMRIWGYFELTTAANYDLPHALAEK